MEGRGVTNLLLAVIAGVLLFGKDAMVSGLQGFLFVAVAIAVIWGVLALIGWAVREILDAYRQAKDWKEKALTTAGFLMMAVLFPLAAYVGWFWLSGVERPIDAALDSWLGIAWTGIAIVGAVGWFGSLAFMGLRWVYDSREGLLSRGFYSLLTAIASPVLFPLREWRFKRESGSGVVVSLFSSVYAMLLGFALWMVLLVVVSFTLLGLGIVD